MSQLTRTTLGAAPITPRTPVSTPVTPSTQVEQDATPGKWKHPKFDEIARRQYATTFDERNVRIIAVNGALMFATFAAPSVISNVALLRILSRPVLVLLPQNADSWSLFLLRAFFLFNIARAFMPLALRYYPDDIADIPLTPSQRQAMGLKPGVSVPQTPGSAYASPNYVTPPRYQKSTPRGSFSAQGDRASQSPLSGSPRASMAKSTSNSPFTPGLGSSAKRMSFGGNTPSGSLFGDSFSSSSAAPSTPTPSTGRASVGLNNKWLYERRRDGSRGSMFS
ncbi:hypothetical protein BU23DRAFT_557391 [Bimuria novae-zelandiae CBS 107.79]|uniref:NPCC-domain-containing protein n=1 Tax=Bimuria novae-zelandiae CBS 107.79 TaxID=1447943 RepID=A0A6A5UY72_9PLEO|nr:hypothetical protein BU23DRAFT_557391 [Bimuria novae-zelandiae CBS 107.79]